MRFAQSARHGSKLRSRQLAARGGDGGSLGGVPVIGAVVLVVGLSVWFIVRAHRRRKLVHTAATEAALDEPHLDGLRRPLQTAL